MSRFVLFLVIAFSGLWTEKESAFGKAVDEKYAQVQDRPPPANPPPTYLEIIQSGQKDGTIIVLDCKGVEKTMVPYGAKYLTSQEKPYKKRYVVYLKEGWIEQWDGDDIGGRIDATITVESISFLIIKGSDSKSLTISRVDGTFVDEFDMKTDEGMGGFTAEGTCNTVTKLQMF
jgi:hypothetical protein